MIETERLILRPWRKDDILPFSEINCDEEVMEYLPKCLSMEETVQFYNRIVAEHDRFGYGLYAVETKNDGSFIGYVGFHHFDFDAEFSPGVEIGWRLAGEHWNQGYATEAAKACLDYPKMNNGEVLDLPHYPPTQTDIDSGKATPSGKAVKKCH